MKNLLFLFLVFLSTKSYSQLVDVTWSTAGGNQKNKSGYSEVIEGDGKYLYTSTIFDEIGYTLYGTEGIKKDITHLDNMLVAYDIETLTEVASVKIGGDQSLLSGNPDFKNYTLSKALALKDKVIIFVRSYNKDGGQIIAVVETTPEFKLLGKPRIVHETRTPQKYSRFETDILFNPQTGGFVFINEYEGQQKNILMEYKTLSADYSIVDVGSVDLPFAWDAGWNRKGREYKILGNDYLVLNANVKEEVPKAPRKKRWIFYSVFTIVSLSENTHGTYTLKSDERKYSGIHMQASNGVISILGFYSNTNDEGENLYLNGFFSTNLDVKTGEFINTATSDFDNDFLMSFKNHYPDKIKGRKEAPFTYVNGIKIEKRLESGDKTILVCYVQNNEIIKYSNGNELPHCVNRGVFTLVLNSGMQLEKYHVLPRVSRYDFIHNVDDVEVAPLGNGSYVIAYSSNADLKEVNNEGKPDMREEEEYEKDLYYAVMNASGELQAGKIYCDSNILKTDKKFKFLPNQFRERGDKLYVFGVITNSKKDKQVVLGRFTEK